MATTTRWGLRYPVGADAPDVPLWMNRLATDLDDVAKDDQGLAASRPVSTGGSPGKKGRYYRSTDVAAGVLERDNGTGWDVVADVEKLGLTSNGVVRRGKFAVAGQNTRTNGAYGTMSTPDQVDNIVLPTDGLIAVLYQASWQETVVNAARAALFIGANQVQIAGGAGATTQAAATGAAAGPNRDQPLVTGSTGLVGMYGGGADSQVTTGQIVGTGRDPNTVEVGGSAAAAPPGVGGPCYVFAAAGTYTVSVQFKALAGATVTVKNRHLWVWTIAF